MGFNELCFYKAYNLNKIKNEYIESPELEVLYDFLASEFFEVLNFSKEAHRKFFWAMLYKNSDFADLISQANAWSIPIFSFESHHEAHKRIINGINFIRLKGSKAQTNEILDIVFNKGKWRFNVYSDRNFISLDVIDLNEAKLNGASEYLDYSLPPYIGIDIVKYPFPSFERLYGFNEIVELGGRNFLMKMLVDYIYDALIMPRDSFSIGSSKLGRDLLKITEITGEEIDAIVLFSTVTSHEINSVIKSFFLKDVKVFVF